MTKSLEEKKAAIMAEAQAKLAEAEAKCAILEVLPLQPNFVHVHSLYGSIGSVVYDPATKADALAIFNAYPDILPSYICRGGGTCAVKAVPGEKDERADECLATAEINQHEQTIEFYVKLPMGIVRVEIRLGFNPFGHYYRDDQRARTRFRYLFAATIKLGELKHAVTYAPVSPVGEMSAKMMIYAIHERRQVEYILSEEE